MIREAVARERARAWIEAATTIECEPWDQRRLSRPQPEGGSCDIGAYERQRGACGAQLLAALLAPVAAFIVGLRPRKRG